MERMPWFTRPEVRLRRDGASNLSDSELLSLVLSDSRPNGSSLKLANAILSRKNFHYLSDMSFAEIRSSIQDDTASVKLAAMFEIFRKTRRLERKGYRQVIESPEDVYNHFADDLKDRKKEHLYALLLDSKNRIIKRELISVGTLNSSLVHPREVFSSAVRISANSIILVHNHPSGNPEPSREDRMIHQVISRAGEILGIPVLDHIVVAQEGFARIVS